MKKRSAPGSKCARCKDNFDCRAESISSCDCMKVQLSAEDREHIRASYEGCLCSSCLLEVKNGSGRAAIGKHPAKAVSFALILLLACKLDISWSQTYAPPAGQAGTTAMYKDSSAFKSWASGCTVVRGYQDISDPSLGFASVGDISMATGKAQSNGVLSLGDRGTAVCTFDQPVTNGPGADFAVFENSIDDTFLELAFVEVSSDGINFFRFQAHSLTDPTVQTDGFGSTDATKINNLAGKYRAGYGTPFDLQELSTSQGLNINAVTHIKIVDVVGSIDNNYTSRDFYNNKVNDPWPTPFPSGGFDLDAIGVIHQAGTTGIDAHSKAWDMKVYPNPVTQGSTLFVGGIEAGAIVSIYTAAGILILSADQKEIKTDALEKGMYLLTVKSGSSFFHSKLVVH